MMPSGLFESYEVQLEPLRAQRLLDAAQAASAHLAGAEWWERMIAAARGVAAEVVRRAGPLFTFNKRPINTSSGLRRAFAEGVSGSRVES